MEKLYKILVIGLLLKDNKVHPFGTEVTEDQLPDPAAELIAAGYIEEIEPSQSVKIEKVEAPVVEAPVVEAPVDTTGPNPADLIKKNNKKK